MVVTWTSHLAQLLAPRPPTEAQIRQIPSSAGASMTGPAGGDHA